MINDPHSHLRSLSQPSFRDAATIHVNDRGGQDLNFGSPLHAHTSMSKIEIGLKKRLVER